MTVAIFDYVLAFRQAKIALYYERRGVGLRQLADYESSLERNLAELSARRIGSTWFDDVELGDVLLAPKSTVSVPAAPREGAVIVVGAAPVDIDLTVRVQLSPHPNLSIVEVMYIWEFGPALDALLSESCLGYRLNLHRGAVDRASRHLFGFWPRAFERYRDEPIEVARRHLDTSAGSSPRACTVTSLDFTSFYDSIDPAFLLEDKFVDRVQSAAVAAGLPFRRARFLRATRSLVGLIARYWSERADLIGHRGGVGLPIGALTSRIVANVALAELDQELRADPKTLGYFRYVDDLVIVRDAGSLREQSSLDIAEYLESWFPRIASRDDGRLEVDPGVGRFLLAFQKTKTKIHYLEGPAGIEFLAAIRESFAAVASERRAFSRDIGATIEELDVLGGGIAVERQPMVALRDADAALLKRLIHERRHVPDD